MTRICSVLESRIHGCLWGLAVGNLLGLSTESFSRPEVRGMLGEQGPLLCLPVEEADRPWDDDLAMAVKLAEWLCEGTEDPAVLMNAYLCWFMENGRGAGSLTSSVMVLAKRGDFLAAQTVWKSHRRSGRPPQGNGSLMRVAPIGLAYASEPRRIRDLALLDASLTHWDPICGEASAFLALVISALVNRQAEAVEWAKAAMETRVSAELASILEPISLEDLEARRLDGEDMGHVLLTLRIALAVLNAGLSFEEGLLWTLRQGGDTDTNGAVVGALCGARDGLEAIPPEWRACLSQPEKLQGIGERIIRISLVGSLEQVKNGSEQ